MATSKRFEYSKLPYSTLKELEFLLDELEMINPSHEFLAHGWEIIHGMHDDDPADVADFLDAIREIIE